MFELRPYQTESIEMLRKALAKKKKICLVLPTGAGKSAIFAEIIRLSLGKTKRILFLVHRRNLVTQMKETLNFHGIQDVGIIMAGHESNTGEMVQIGTIQTYARRLKLKELEFNRFFIDADVVLIDETHRAISQTYNDVTKLYKDKVIIGCTATPMRSDGRGLGELFEEIVDITNITDLTAQGYLSPARYWAPSEPDLSGLKIVMGDYEKKGLESRTNTTKLIGDIVDNWFQIAPGEQTIIFCVSVKHSIAICEAFNSRGIPTYHLDAKSPDDVRESVFRDMENGLIKIICNVALYQEGMDCPNISCVVMARPTKSLGLYRQCCGRGLRPSPGKTHLKIIDHAGVIAEHGLLTEEVEWQLSGKEKAWKKKKAKEEKVKKQLQCKVCNLIFDGASVCPDCGSEVKSFGKDVETTKADLKEVGAKTKYNMVDKMRYLGMLKHWVDKKGKNPKIILAKYKTKFGVWPDNRIAGVLPIEPDYKFLQMMIAEQIRYVKGRGRYR